MNQFKVKIIRDGSTRVDWNRGELIIRKPRPLPEGRDPAEFGCRSIQAKCDGIHVVMSGGAVLTTQGHNIFDMYPLMEQPAWFRNLSNEHFVEGELHVPGKGREAVKTALKETPELLRLAVFGTDRLRADATLSELAEWCKLHALDSLDFLPVGALPSTIEWSAKVIGMKYDGVVYKQSMYGAWYKQKNERTIDCVVTGLKLGVGKYWGMCGAITVSVQGREIANVSGMRDDVRAMITKEDIGRVCEVKYERVGSKGRLQHPRFVCWRDDKAPEDCLSDQDPDLENQSR